MTSVYEFNRRDVSDVVEPIPFAEFRAKVLELYAPPMRSKSTFGKVRQVLDLFAALPGVATTADLTTANVARFLTTRPGTESPNTTYSLFACLRTIVNIAAAEGWIRVNPFSVRRRWVRRSTPKPIRVHSREEIARVLDLTKRETERKSGWPQWRAHRLHALTAVVAFTGLRRNEALSLRVEDIDLEAGMILIVARVNGLLKTEASAQPVPIPQALSAILRGWLDRLASHDCACEMRTPDDGTPRPWKPTGPVDFGWVFPNAYRTGPWKVGSRGYRPIDRLRAVGKRANIPGLSFLSLRHSWATHAEYWGLSDAMIQRVMRHTNTRTQWHYRHAELQNLREKLGGIDFGPSDHQ